MSYETARLGLTGNVPAQLSSLPPSMAIVLQSRNSVPVAWVYVQMQLLGVWGPLMVLGTPRRA